MSLSVATTLGGIVGTRVGLAEGDAKGLGTLDVSAGDEVGKLDVAAGVGEGEDSGEGEDPGEGEGTGW